MKSFIQGFEKDIDQVQHEMSRFIWDSVGKGAKRELSEAALKEQNANFERLVAVYRNMKDKIKKIIAEKLHTENELSEQK